MKFNSSIWGPGLEGLGAWQHNALITWQHPHIWTHDYHLSTSERDYRHLHGDRFYRHDPYEITDPEH